MRNQDICLPVEWKDWEVVGTIGSGSYGTVYEIHRNIYGYIEKSALKVVSIPQSSNEIVELRNDGYDEESITAHFQDCLESIVKEYTFVREMKGYTNVVYCDDLKCIQHDDGIGWDVYIKMELLTPLTEYLSKKVTDEQVIQLGLDICNALVHCRDKKIIHRDIKPQNIFVSEEGSFKLGDFGAAKIIEKTASGTKIGTYNYMAPEVYKGNPYGCTTDMYSLGLVMYWLLNDRRLPFLPLPPQQIVPSMAEQARSRRFCGESLPKPIHGNEALKAIVLKACAYDPTDRYSSPEDMMNALSILDPTDGIFSSKAEKERIRQERKRELERQREEARQREVERLQELERQKEIERKKAEEIERIKQQNEEQQKKQKRKKQCILISGAIAVLIIVFAMIVMLIKLEKHVHTWENATCIAPKICSECGETDGSPLGHTWMEATCTIPKTCTECGEVSGTAKDHQWKNTTGDETSICSMCGAIDGTTKGNLTVSVNDIVVFGNYEQDSQKSNGAEPIEWIVLEVREDRALLLSRYALDSLPYNNTYEPITWEKSTLRNWLNTTFLGTAFSEDELNQILVTEVDNSVTQCNRKWPFNGGNNTKDAIFLLSYADIDLYFDSPADCICMPTNHAVDMGADIRTLDDGSSMAGWWWLRSPGEKSHHAAFVNFDGTRYTNAVGNEYLAVRPAVWIRLDEESQESPSKILPVEIIRDRIPMIAFALSSEEKIYGYEDAELTKKSDSYYFKPATDEIVITDISEDGSALKIRYPSSLTSSGYRSLWFSTNEIISLLEIEIGDIEANTETTTYRYLQSNDSTVHYGTMEGGNKYVVLGTHESGYRAIIYSIYRKTKYGIDVHYKLALIK